MGMSPGCVVVVRMAEAGAGADEVAANRELWTQANSEYADEHALRAWAAEDISWGIFNVPEQQLGVLGDVRGLDVVELGCILVTVCSPGLDGPAGQELLHPQRQAHRLATPRGGMQFHPGHGEWIKLLRDSGFIIDALHELYAPPDAPDHLYYALASAGWARQWPAEEIWAAYLAD
jgi:hypothetical protein